MKMDLYNSHLSIYQTQELPRPYEDEAIHSAQECLALEIMDMESRGEKLPDPSMNCNKCCIHPHLDAIFPKCHKRDLCKEKCDHPTMVGYSCKRK